MVLEQQLIPLATCVNEVDLRRVEFEFSGFKKSVDSLDTVEHVYETRASK